MLRERTGRDPIQLWILGLRILTLRPNRVIVHNTGSQSRQPFASEIALPGSRHRAGTKTQRLHDDACLGPPQPGAARYDRMRRGERQGSTGERQPIVNQPRAEGSQKIIRLDGAAGAVDQPGES